MAIISGITHTGGRVLSSDPFGADACIDLKVNDKDQAESVLISPTRPQYTNLQAVDSGAFGQPTKEQIWAFESRVLADQLILCRALANKLNDTVHGLGRQQWEDGITALLKDLPTVQEEAMHLCDTVVDSIEKPKRT